VRRHALRASMPAMDPWLLEIITVHGGTHDAGMRRVVSRDVERGLLVRLRQGAYVERAAFEAMSPEDQHVVRIRAFAAVAAVPPVFSHWSAAVLLGLPVLRSRLATVHTVVDERRGRGQVGVTAHLFPVTVGEQVQIGEVVSTSVPRTVVDVAGASPFDEGVMVADAALRSGVPREALEQAIEVAGPRRAASRITDVVAFAHPGAESAAESGSRVRMLELGIEPPVLQRRIELDSGAVVFVDFFFPVVGAGGEADGDTKYLDPRIATRGTGRALVAEKRREDELRLRLNGLARWGWRESRRLDLMRRLLHRIEVRPAAVRATLADYAALAREARPRFLPRRPIVQR
jgi:hypothetical protein